MSTSTSDQRKERKCFIVTPIGDPSSPIRRHIDGIIDAAIIPALEKAENVKYEVIVPHRIYDSTAITKQIYMELYESDLVIANLTGLNPNVMYELAIRFCIGKPVIMIAEYGTILPFDVKDQRVHFYTNDAKGTIELINEINNALNAVDYDGEKKSPIHDAISEAVLFETVEQSDTDNKIEKMLSLIMDKLDKTESSKPSGIKVHFPDTSFNMPGSIVHKNADGSMTIEAKSPFEIQDSIKPSILGTNLGIGSEVGKIFALDGDEKI